MSPVSFMRVRTVIGALIAMFVLWGALGGEALAGETGEVKRGILLVAFGSSVSEGQEAISAVEEAVKRAWPDTEVRLAFTSRIIMRKVAREQNRVIDEPAVALAKMAYEGFTHVAVLSTHIIPGAEFDDLAAVVDGFKMISGKAPKAGFRYIGLSSPLLSNPVDLERMAAALTDTYAAEVKSGAVVLVGHGTHHFADAAYSALQMVLSRISPNFYIGTIEGIPSYEDVLPRLKAAKVKNVYLGPAMLVAGDHAQNDIAGGEPDSWKSMLTKEGYKVTPILTGLGQNNAVQNLLLDKLREAWGGARP